MAQGWPKPFPHQTAAQLVQPGPLTHDGLQFDDADPAAGQKTQALINAMCDDLGTWNLGLPLEEELARTWQDDMIWWGPTGSARPTPSSAMPNSTVVPSEPPLPIDRLAGIYAEYQKVIMAAFSAGQLHGASHWWFYGSAIERAIAQL